MVMSAIVHDTQFDSFSERFGFNCIFDLFLNVFFPNEVFFSCYLNILFPSLET